MLAPPEPPLPQHSAAARTAGVPSTSCSSLTSSGVALLSEAAPALAAARQPGPAQLTNWVTASSQWRHIEFLVQQYHESMNPIHHSAVLSTLARLVPQPERLAARDAAQLHALLQHLEQLTLQAFAGAQAATAPATSDVWQFRSQVALAAFAPPPPGPEPQQLATIAHVSGGMLPGAGAGEHAEF